MSDSAPLRSQPDFSPLSLTDEQVAASKRARLMVLRRSAISLTEEGSAYVATIPQVGEMSACLADLVAAERRLYE